MKLSLKFFIQHAPFEDLQRSEYFLEKYLGSNNNVVLKHNWAFV